MQEISLLAYLTDRQTLEVIEECRKLRHFRATLTTLPDRCLAEVFHADGNQVVIST